MTVDGHHENFAKKNEKSKRPRWSTCHGGSSRDGRIFGQRCCCHAQPVPPNRRFLCFLIQSSVGPKKPTGTGSVLNEKTTTRTKTNDLNPYTRRTRLGSRLFLEYLDLSIRNMVREDFNAKYNL